MTRRRDSNSWTVVRLPERDLAEVVLDLAAPLLERLGPSPLLGDARGAIDLAVAFWNASVLASKRWDHPRLKELNELRKRMRGRQAPREDAAMFDVLTERRRSHWLDPRLVESWTYDADDAGVRRLVCSAGLPDGVYAEVPPPIEKRIAIGGKFLDEVRMRRGVNTYVGYPETEHHGVIGDDGTVTVHARMPTALQLFAEGRLPAQGGAPVEVMVGGRTLGPMILAEVRCAGESYRNEVAVLIFKPASTDRPRPGAGEL